MPEVWLTFAEPAAVGVGRSKQVSDCSKVVPAGTLRNVCAGQLIEEDTCEGVKAAGEGRLCCSHNRWPQPTPWKALELNWLFKVVSKWVQALEPLH